MISRKILLIVVALAFAGCATPTKPNIPYSVPIPELDNIAQRNMLLATELRKLPEIQDGVSPLESSALEKIVELYDRFPDKFDKALEQMYEVGIPEVRKYCSPLQTLFWLVEDGKINICNQVINNYDLKTLLDGGWKTEKFGIKEYGGLIFNEDLKNHKKRWGNFSEVIDRLNAPELLHYYDKMNISDEDYWGERKTNKSVFEDGCGNCVDVSQFNTFCLSKAGYKTYLIAVHTTYGNHMIAAFKDKGKIYILDKYGPYHYFKGPYDSLYKIPYSIRGFR